MVCRRTMFNLNRNFLLIERLVLRHSSYVMMLITLVELCG